MCGEPHHPADRGPVGSARASRRRSSPAADVTVAALPAITNAATVPVSFSTDPDVTVKSCSFDGGDAVPCASGWSGIGASTADGTHTYRVSVIDDVGNGATSAPVTTILDRTAPALAFADGPSEGQQVVTRTATITFSLDEAHPGTVGCTLDVAVKRIVLPKGAVLQVKVTSPSGATRTARWTARAGRAPKLSVA